MTSFMDRLKASYNILANRVTETPTVSTDNHITSFSPISLAQRVSYDSSQAVLSPILTRISVDAASVPIRHVQIDELGQFVSVKQSELNDRLTIRANLDQSGTAFIQDAVMTMLREGSCALVPIEVTQNPDRSVYDILSIRVGSITQWFNGAVEVSVYNELTGERTQKIVPKNYVAIAYNPFHAVMNEANSTLRRLIDRLALLDVADGKQFSTQLDLIIQLPYTLKNDRRQAEAERRITAIEEQLADSKYGVAYIDATEKITQLNRPATNSLFETVQALTDSLHSQLGLTPAIFSGSATPEEMLSYNNRTINPIITALTEAMISSFFTRTAIRQGNSIMGFPTLFKMAPIGELADAADKLTRNEIMTSNEVRSQIGLPPSKDPEADKLRNKNLNKPEPEKKVEIEETIKTEPANQEADDKERSND